MFKRLDNFFPLPSQPRQKQAKALDFIYRMIELGFKDIVIAAPTGVGKTAIGMAACLWGADAETTEALQQHPGGYYLVTQKMLQDQISDDFERFPNQFKNTGVTLKTASEYLCESHLDCASGHAATKDWLLKCKNMTSPPSFPTEEDEPKPCQCLAHIDSLKNKWVRHPDKADLCHYEHAKANFVNRAIGVTNYAFWLSERLHVGAFPIKNVMVMDEAHNLEKTLLSFVELGVTPKQIQEFATDVENNKIDNRADFVTWLTDSYKPAVELTYEYLRAESVARPKDKTLSRQLRASETHYTKVTQAIAHLKTEPHNWVYWCEEKPDGYHYILKPLNAAPYFKDLIMKSSCIRIYMSAYMGPKNVFCRTLGLNPDSVAWLNLSSTFPPENRPVCLALVGSMGRKSYTDTLPRMLNACHKILDRHADSKGLIHCASYKIGQAIYEYFQNTPHKSRIIMPNTARNRTELFNMHKTLDEPTVLLSPSMTEGYSLDDDLARFQIIAKISYPYLGDLQIKTKMEQDAKWYALQTISSVIQATGRIVRSDTDTGVSYILDSDFQRLYENNPEFFPKWWVEALRR